MMSQADLVWNRAAMEHWEPVRRGDSALAALLRAHGMVCNGGVFHCIETHSSAELEQGCAGFRFFGLAEVAALLEEAASKVTREAARAGDYDEELEFEFDGRYGELIPDDNTIVRRFEARFASHPEDFAPSGSNRAEFRTCARPADWTRDRRFLVRKCTRMHTSNRETRVFPGQRLAFQSGRGDLNPRPPRPERDLARSIYLRK